MYWWTTHSYFLAEPPKITTNPNESESIYPGKSVSFTVQATGTKPLKYQWQWRTAGEEGESEEWQNICDTSGSTFQQVGTGLKLTGFQTCNAGYYRCVVSNSAGSETSQYTKLVAGKCMYSVCEYTTKNDYSSNPAPIQLLSWLTLWMNSRRSTIGYTLASTWALKFQGWRPLKKIIIPLMTVAESCLLTGSSGRFPHGLLWSRHWWRSGWDVWLLKLHKSMVGMHWWKLSLLYVPCCMLFDVYRNPGTSTWAARWWAFGTAIKPFSSRRGKKQVNILLSCSVHMVDCCTSPFNQRPSDLCCLQMFRNAVKISEKLSLT